MADVNLTQEEFLTYEGLGYFKGKQDALNDQKIAKAKQEVIDVTDPAGSAAAVQTKLDEEVARAKAAEEVAKKAGDDAQADLNAFKETYATDKSALEEKDTALQGEVDAIEADMGNVDDLQTANKTVAGAINEVLAAVGTGGTASVVTVTTDTTSDGALKSYTIKQGETTVGVIDIPKDMVVENGEVVTNPEGQPEGTYIKLTLANVTEPLYINVGTLVDIYKAKANATQVQLTIDSASREISATIVAGSIGTTELADDAVTTVKIADANVTLAKLSTTLQASIAKADAAAPQTKLDEEVQARKDADTAMDTRVKAIEEAMGEGGSVGTQIDDKIAELDADVTSAAVEAGKGVQVQVVETDGKVASVAVTGNFDNSYDAKGSAATAKAEAISAAAEDATTKANQAETNAKAEVTALANGAVADNAQAIADIQAAMPTAITNAKIDELFATV